MLQIAFALAWTVTITGLFAAAWWRGGWPERAATAAALTAWLLTVVVLQATKAWFGPHLGLFLIDTGFLAILGVIGFRTAKLWPLFACGFQLCGVGLHLAYFVEPVALSGAYFVGLQITSVAVLAAIGAGVVATCRKHRPARVRRSVR